jgi:hypothetical protein
MPADLVQIIPTLIKTRVDFVLIGGMAGTLHGSARVTFDVDLVYSRTRENIERLANALGCHAPKLRDAPPDIPLRWDSKTIRSGLNFTLTTDLGDIDLFGELAGGETYEDLLSHSFEAEAFGVQFRCVDLPTLIRIKEAAGRAKDHEAIAELRVLLEEEARRSR